MSQTVCNARKRGHNGLAPADAGAWAGDGYCKARAGKGTDHLGQGRCRFHGGLTPIKHGGYSSVARPTLRDRIETFRQDPDPLNMEEELALARAILDRYLSTGSPDELNHKTAMKLVTAVSRIVKRIEDIQSVRAIKPPAFLRLMEEMGRVVNREVEDPEVLEAICESWSKIKL